MIRCRGVWSLLVACAGLLAVAGCGTVSTGYAGDPTSPPAARPTAGPPPGGVNVAAFDALARQEAAAWARSPLARTWRTGLVVLAPDLLSAGPSGSPGPAARP